MSAVDGLYAIARQMQIRNALELVRIAFDHAWSDDLTATIGTALQIGLGDIYPVPERCPHELRGCRCLLPIDHPGKHGAIERETLIVWAS